MIVILKSSNHRIQYPQLASPHPINKYTSYATILFIKFKTNLRNSSTQLDYIHLKLNPSSVLLSAPLCSYVTYVLMDHKVVLLIYHT